MIFAALGVGMAEAARAVAAVAVTPPRVSALPWMPAACATAMVPAAKGAMGSPFQGSSMTPAKYVEATIPLALVVMVLSIVAKRRTGL